jgi:hypothetical protein
MVWEVKVSDEFLAWYEGLSTGERMSVATCVEMLESNGPGLGRPYRILFAFDPRRNAYLILGGDKTGDKDWYVDAIRRADAIYAQHLKEIGE